MGKFFSELWETLLPSHWPEISQRPMGRAVGFFSKVLLCAFIIIVLLGIPRMIKMPSVISEQLGKFEVLQLDGKVNMSSPIKLPSNEPLFILDTSGAYTDLTTERVLVTRDKIAYRPLFATHEIATDDLKDLKENREQVNAFLAVLVFFLLPSILFYVYILVWLKYFVMIFTLSIILFLLLDLTHWRRTWRELFVIACYTSTLPVLAEVIVSAINAHWLIPVMNIAGLVTLYLIPAVVLAVLTIGAAMCVHEAMMDKKK